LSHHTLPDADVLLPQRVPVPLLTFFSDLRGKTKKNAEKVQKKVEEKREKIKKYERQKLTIEERKLQIENPQVRAEDRCSYDVHIAPIVCSPDWDRGAIVYHAVLSFRSVGSSFSTAKRTGGHFGPHQSDEKHSIQISQPR
jgi:hypothetical protein